MRPTTVDTRSDAAVRVHPGREANTRPERVRGVTLAGINSVHVSFERRQLAWSRLASDLDVASLASMTQVVGLSDAIDVAAKILDGEVRGRVVVDVNR